MLFQLDAKKKKDLIIPMCNVICNIPLNKIKKQELKKIFDYSLFALFLSRCGHMRGVID